MNQDIGTHRKHFKRIDSTHLYCMREGRGLAHGTVVTADVQESGRGRLGRIWIAPAGSSLLVSVIIKPDMAPVAVPQLTLALALACARALGEQGLSTKIRWPNDIICGNRKVAGILAEAQLDGDAISFAVLSIGINLTQTPEQLAEIDRPATSCAVETGQTFKASEVLEGMLHHLKELCAIVAQHGFAGIRPEWESRCALTGKDVSLDLGQRTVEGKVVGIDGAGGLTLNCADGIHSFTAGEVVRVAGRTIC